MEKIPANIPFDEVNTRRGNRLMLMLFAYGSTKDILAMNCYEVLRFVQEIESGRFTEVALDRSRRLEYRVFENHLIRYVHNFLAAAKTLVDHTRNMMRSADIVEAHRAAYQAEVNSNFLDPLSRFIGDFRNYTLHFGLPKLVHTYSVDDERWQVGLNLRALRPWASWTSASLEFIQSQPDRIRLSWLVASYQTKAMSLHTWILDSFITYYAGRFEEFESLRAKVFEQSSA